MLGAGASETNQLLPSWGRWPRILSITRLYHSCTDSGMNKVLSGKKGSLMSREIGKTSERRGLLELSLEECSGV